MLEHKKKKLKFNKKYAFRWYNGILRVCLIVRFEFFGLKGNVKKMRYESFMLGLARFT